jgi:hypothetical protein
MLLPWKFARWTHLNVGLILLISHVMTNIKNWELGKRPLVWSHTIPVSAACVGLGWLDFVNRDPFESTYRVVRLLGIEILFHRSNNWVRWNNIPCSEDWHWMLPEISSELISIWSSQNFATFKGLRQALLSEGLWGKCCAIKSIPRSRVAVRRNLSLGYENLCFGYFFWGGGLKFIWRSYIMLL